MQSMPGQGVQRIREIFNFSDKRCFHPLEGVFAHLNCVNALKKSHIAGLLNVPLLRGNVCTTWKAARLCYILNP
ncbi:hypothetical protein [Comamonas endophytica]|uniref:DDE family transposase n=1 Tax=Comamonas endophytica TaxID=2949090 RepID=A0ABY6G6E5_9BURK|nr:MULTISPECIES: hypothetical protein [unclassified Acidovorax]MCD2511180.1 hypothetical protein [Acidovorax sp. D4N7]UYG50579.1 hypothetical protein M9799_10765 [Acidovorax sp. 5MLIR]